MRKRFHAASLACYESPSALARLEGDRDERDRAVALAAALAAMQSRQREHERDANATRFDVAEFYVDVARVMPPNVDRHSVHVGAAAAALAAMVRSFPETAVDAEEAMRRAAVIPALTGMTLGTAGHKSHAALAGRSAPTPCKGWRMIPRGAIHRGPSCRLSRRPCPPPEEKRRRRGFRDTQIERRRVGVEDEVEGGAALDAADDAAESVEMRAHAASKTAKEMVAMQTISLQKLKGKRKQYLKKLKWSTLFMANLGWFLAMFVWFFGGYVIIVYGVLIYRYLGPGEESRSTSPRGA